MLSQLKSFYYFYETEIVKSATASSTGNDTKMNDTITEID
jgi:hypothetical protein